MWGDSCFKTQGWHGRGLVLLHPTLLMDVRPMDVTTSFILPVTCEHQLYSKQRARCDGCYRARREEGTDHGPVLGTLDVSLGRRAVCIRTSKS